MTTRHWLAASCLLLIFSSLGVTLAHASPNTASTPSDSTAVFAPSRLLPGENLTGAITVPGAQIAVFPFLRADDVTTACTLCASQSTSLAGVLTLSATAPGGATWTGTIIDLERGIALPGGLMPAGGDRTYALKLSLPTSAGNAYEDMTISAQLTWGGQDASGATTSVLGENLTRNPPTPRSENTLPLTGVDTFLLLGLTVALLGIGGACIAMGRQRRHPDVSGPLDGGYY